MKKFLIAVSLIVQALFTAGSTYAFSGYYYESCPGCNEENESQITIPTPTPSFENQQKKCYTEEYVCGQTCWDGSYDGDRSRQGMGYCFDKICTRTVCEE